MQTAATRKSRLFSTPMVAAEELWPRSVSIARLQNTRPQCGSFSAPTGRSKPERQKETAGVSCTGVREVHGHLLDNRCDTAGPGNEKSVDSRKARQTTDKNQKKKHKKTHQEKHRRSAHPHQAPPRLRGPARPAFAPVLYLHFRFPSRLLRANWEPMQILSSRRSS